MRTLLLAQEDDPELNTELERYASQYFPAYEDGHLLEEGGWSDQPARYAALIRAMKDWDARVAARYLEITKANSEPQ